MFSNLWPTSLLWQHMLNACSESRFYWHLKSLFLPISVEGSSGFPGVVVAVAKP